MIYIIIAGGLAVIFSLILGIIGFVSNNFVLIFSSLSLLIGAIGICTGSIIVYFTERDNISNATIFIRMNGQTRPVKAKSISGSLATGITYQFSFNNQNEEITIPADYGVNFINHRRRIDIDFDKSIIALDKHTKLHQHRYDAVIKALTLGHIGKDIVNAVKSGKTNLSILFVVIALIIGVIIGGLLVPRLMKQTQQSIAPPVTQPTQPTQPSDNNTIIGIRE